MDLPENLIGKRELSVLSVHQPGAKKGCMVASTYERLALVFLTVPMNKSRSHHFPEIVIQSTLTKASSTFDSSREDFCAIAADTKGPEIRTGILGGKIQNVDLKLVIKSSYRWTLHKESCTKDLIYCDYSTLLLKSRRGKKYSLTTV